jgi:hypothetical protein
VTDAIRYVELFDLHGHRRRADLGRVALVAGAYLDTGAGRTIVSSEVSRRVLMLDVPGYKIQYTVPITQTADTKMTAIRMRARGCGGRDPVPILVAVSDEIIGKLELPGVEILLGQDFLQAARVRIDLGQGRPRVACRVGR